MTIELTIERLRTRIAQHRAAQMVRPDARRAAVLVPIVAGAGGLFILCCERSAAVADHRSEVAFPGGAVERGDGGAVGTALREAREELGIAAADVEVLGALDDDYVRVSNFVITPVVGYLARLPQLTADPREVERPILVPLAHVAADDTERTERRLIRGEVRDIAYVPTMGAKMWGATLRIVRALLRTWRVQGEG